MAEKELSRVFMLATYEGSENLNTENLWGICSEKAVHAYRSPIHDSDLWTEDDERENPAHKAGESKKPHTHIVIYFTDAKSRSAAAKTIGLKREQVHAWDSEEKAIRYLIHADNAEKHAYDRDKIKGSNEESDKRIAKAFRPHEKTKKEKADDEGTYFLELVNKRVDEHKTYRELLKDAVEAGRYATFRRGFAILKEISNEERIIEKAYVDAYGNAKNNLHREIIYAGKQKKVKELLEEVEALELLDVDSTPEQEEIKEIIKKI